MTKAHHLKNGETTEAALIGLLGPPHGLYVYPLVRSKDDRGLVYLYHQTTKGPFTIKTYSQLLKVTVRDGIVNDIELTTSGER